MRASIWSAIVMLSGRLSRLAKRRSSMLVTMLEIHSGRDCMNRSRGSLSGSATTSFASADVSK